MPVWLNAGGDDYYEGEEETRERSGGKIKMNLIPLSLDDSFSLFKAPIFLLLIPQQWRPTTGMVILYSTAGGGGSRGGGCDGGEWKRAGLRSGGRDSGRGRQGREKQNEKIYVQRWDDLRFFRDLQTH